MNITIQGGYLIIPKEETVLVEKKISTKKMEKVY